jgi:NAD-dependent DNA ligase
MLDEHGQPTWAVNHRLRQERAVENLLGMARGIICDGVFNDYEVMELRAWIRENPDACVTWPGSDLCDRIQRILADGMIDEAERAELRDFLEALSGERQVSDTDDARGAVMLPLDVPPPPISFEGSRFVLTGHFLCGVRDFVAHRIESRGALVDKAVTKRTNYLLIGSMASRDWKHSNYGTKIRKAVEYRTRGVPLAIIAEDHWAAQLRGAI